MCQFIQLQWFAQHLPARAGPGRAKPGQVPLFSPRSFTANRDLHFQPTNDICTRDNANAYFIYGIDVNFQGCAEK